MRLIVGVFIFFATIVLLTINDFRKNFGVTCYKFDNQSKLELYLDFDFFRDEATVTWENPELYETHTHDITEKSNVFIKFGYDYEDITNTVYEVVWFFNRETLVLE